ncbi:hypothetical protein BN381_110047 [Candidatus Microthrix parvicella RN1]|uniref:Uncharacterized protein n=1 Tax=Candidatus Neomicrothrix parvicella RN1 TaxID=1229780 RepID=R4YZD4_9ACTN|nr:hypothetical protein BN381_110047 [Candidatus Microthrix parvicella RN1]
MRSFCSLRVPVGARFAFDVGFDAAALRFGDDAEPGAFPFLAAASLPALAPGICDAGLRLLDGDRR